MIPSKEEQCRQVREWCEATGVCPPAEGWEWVWWTRLFLPAEVISNLPAFKA